MRILMRLLVAVVWSGFTTGRQSDELTRDHGAHNECCPAAMLNVPPSIPPPPGQPPFRMAFILGAQKSGGCRCMPISIAIHLSSRHRHDLSVRFAGGATPALQTAGVCFKEDAIQSEQGKRSNDVRRRSGEACSLA